MKHILFIVGIITSLVACQDDRTTDRDFENIKIGTLNGYTVEISAIKNGDTLYYYWRGSGGSHRSFYSMDNLTKFNTKTEK